MNRKKGRKESCRKAVNLLSSVIIIREIEKEIKFARSEMERKKIRKEKNPFSISPSFLLVLFFL